MWFACTRLEHTSLPFGGEGSKERGRSSFLLFMVFVLLYTPCLATVVTLWRESGALKWMLFSVSYQLILAWTTAWVVFRLARFL
ncbi:MAG: hypothetical protein HGB17_06810, partial [Syntrophobacteraceae bacterium]|nr:hypothetical protein [Syntrophobacteraceae bacterium]